VTFGCILLGDEASEALYRWAEAGTIVAVRREGFEPGR
jgi:hypothetical protein